MTKIFIKDLELFGYFGVYDFEQDNGQKFIVNFEGTYDTFDVRDTDELEYAIDYAEVADVIKTFFEESRYQLLEKAVSVLVDKLFVQFPLLAEIDLSIAKPDAPVRMEFGSMGVKEHRKLTKCALSLGSNMGDREAYLTEAIEALRWDERIKRFKSSSIIETKPYGKEDQENFLNCAVTFYTWLTPRELFKLTSSLEEQAGRVRTEHWGPRTLDIDILLYGTEVIMDSDLCIPHVDMHNRGFVVEPLKEIAPYMVHPLLSKRICEIKDYV